jgi:hypothetical protein
MKNRIVYALIFALIIFLISCHDQNNPLTTSSNLSNDQLARNTLMRFLNSLHNGEFAQAAQLYGGVYQTMLDQNLGVSPNDHAALFHHACTQNGMQCLQVNSVILDKKISDVEYLYKVAFLQDDGTPFVLEPCCGSDDVGVSSQQAFYFTVVEMDPGKFVVLDLPPYVP